MSATYTTRPDEREPRRFRVRRDGVEVASIYEDPTFHGEDRVRYEGAVASVSMCKVRWAGEIPDWRSGQAHLAYDFVSKAQRVTDVLPEVIEHVEALLAWRAR